MGLAKRIVLAYAGLVTALVAAILYLIDLKLATELHADAVNKGESLAATLSEAVAGAVLTEDSVGTLRLLDGARRSDRSVRYAYVIDAAGRPLADTFPSGVPPDLLGPDGPGAAAARGVFAMRTEDGLVYDVAAPLLDGRLGVLHVGLATREVDAALGHARRTVLAFAAALLLLGGLVSIAVARSLTRPLEKLCEVAARVRGGDLAARAPEDGPAESTSLARAWNDVTETLARRIAEIRALETYQARLLDSLGDAICVIGPDRRVEYANARAREGLGRTEGSRCSDLFPAGRRPCSACPAEQLLATGEPVFLRHEAPDGTVSEIALMRLERADGTRSLIERSHDVTAFVRLERQLVSLERMALLGEVAAGVAHEVGNPLDGLRSCVNAALKGRTDPARVEKFLTLVIEGVDRIEAIVRRLLTYARPLPLRKEEVSLNAVVEQALLLVSVRVERRGVRLERRLAPEPTLIDADPGALSQVVVNLVLNALDAVEEKGGGEVLVETLARDGATAAVGIRVTDNGTGMTPEVKKNAGTAFFTTKPPGKGTGLGLSVSRGLIEQHGGELVIESEPGKGASITVWVPAPESSRNTKRDEATPCPAAS